MTSASEDSMKNEAEQLFGPIPCRGEACLAPTIGEMFTGIVEATAPVLERSSDGLTIERPTSFDDIKVGSSICVSGACLSVVELSEKSMRFDVVPETWDRTMLGTLKKGDEVDLERAMKMGDRFEGHMVQGHVDGVGKVSSLRVSAGGTSREAVVEYPPSLKPLIVPKGSIAINGVSLTIASVDDKSFTVALIPQTLKETTLGNLREGERVNVEVDVVGKYAQRV